MKHKPILFSTDMVQAILEGRKKMTRRILPIQPLDDDKWILGTLVAGDNKNFGKKNWITFEDQYTISKYDARYFTQKYSIGDILWVRESFTVEMMRYRYKADDYITEEEEAENIKLKWRPSIHMPKLACRIFLKVTDVRCERLHEITDQDAVDEGVYKIADYGSTGYKLYTEPDAAYSDIDAVWSFESLWAKINGQSSWDANPYVWVISFELTDRPVDFLNQINK